MFLYKRSQFQSKQLIDDVFTTFFLLSYTKLVTTSGRILSPLNAVVYKNNSFSNIHQFAEADARIKYFGEKHKLYALISILIIPFIIVPPIFLILYPIKMFQLLLFECRLSTRTIASLNIFVEKYYSCYRDGTEGGKDMRSLASMYFILRWIAISIFQLISFNTSLFLAAIIYASYGTVIALVCPYKRTYMNVIDTLMIENLALLALVLDKYDFEDSNNIKASMLYAVVLSIFASLPLLGLIGFIAYTILKRMIGSGSCLFCAKKHTSSTNKSTAVISQQAVQDGIINGDQELPDHMLHPQKYIYSFENINYVRDLEL